MVLMHKEAVFYSSASKYIEVGMFSYYFIFFRMEDTSNSFVYLDFRDVDFSDGRTCMAVSEEVKRE